MMILLAWTHLLAAMLWIGGMMFLSFILLPVLRRGSFGADRRILFQALARRFRLLVWCAIIVLVATGPLLVSSQTGSLEEPEGWRQVLNLKLWVVAILVLLTAIQDFWLGPLVGRLRRASGDGPSAADQLIIRLTALIGRLGVLLAIVILFLSVALART
jgi:putative copper resistance protein D